MRGILAPGFARANDDDHCATVYDIQTSPAVARTISALATGGDVPDDLRVLGLKRSEIDPARLQGARCDGS